MPAALCSTCLAIAMWKVLPKPIDPNVYLWVVTRNGGEPIPNLN